MRINTVEIEQLLLSPVWSIFANLKGVLPHFPRNQVDTLQKTVKFVLIVTENHTITSQCIRI